MADLNLDAMRLTDEGLQALLDAAEAGGVFTLSIMRMVAKGQIKKCLDEVETWLRERADVTMNLEPHTGKRRDRATALLFVRDLIREVRREAAEAEAR